MLGTVSLQQASAEDPLSWVLLHEMMAGVPSSPERLEVSSWALDVLALELGEDWPKRAVERHVAMHLLSAVGSTIERARLVEFAIRLRLIRDRPGRRKALQPLLSGDLTNERIRHTDLQLEVATLGAPLGWSAELEKLNIHLRSGIDVRLTRDAVVLDVEVCALLEGDRTKSSFDQNRRIFGMDLGLMATMHRVRVTGHLSDDPTTYDVDDCRAQLMEAITAVSADGVQRTLSLRGESVLVSLISDGVDDSLTTPFDAALDPRRFESRLKEKVAQARANGSKWIRVDYMDLSWQLSEWWHLPIAGKAHVISKKVKQAVGRDHTLDGVVVSSGAIMRQGEFPAESRVLDNGAVGICRPIEPHRARQTIVVPLSRDGFRRLPLWQEIYENEPSWWDWGLAQFGLPTVRQVTSGESEDVKPS